MKITEVRRRLDGYEAEQLRRIAVELYKAAPKKLREEKDLDQLLIDPDSWAAVRKQRKQAAENPPVAELAPEIDSFVELARAGRYFSPNRLVSKKERSTWRYRVMRWVKQLQRAAARPEEKRGAAELLEKLYVLLCQATEKTIFTSWEPFDSVAISQADFFEHVVLLHREWQAPRPFVQHSLNLIVDRETGLYGPTDQLTEALLRALRTPAMKEMLIEACDEKRRPPEKLGPQALDALAEIGFRSHMALLQPEEAVAYFKRHRKDRSQELVLYVLLRLLLESGNKDLWLGEYETAVAAGVKPRQSLVKAHESICQTGELPTWL